jgi:hypothetical protein
VKSPILRTATAVLVLTAASLLTPHARALANLGGSFESVSADRTALKGVLRSTEMTQYDVHEIDFGSTVVREYVARSGTVFAVTWHGPTPPNLQQLFGSNYFARFHNAAAAAAQDHPSSHRQFSLNQSDFVVQSAGHMRSFVGRAYLPALMPAGLSASDLQ